MSMLVEPHTFFSLALDKKECTKFSAMAHLQGEKPFQWFFTLKFGAFHLYLILFIFLEVK